MPIGAAIPALIGAGGSLLGGMFGSGGQKSQNQANLQGQQTYNNLLGQMSSMYGNTVVPQTANFLNQFSNAMGQAQQNTGSMFNYGLNNNLPIAQQMATQGDKGLAGYAANGSPTLQAAQSQVWNNTSNLYNKTMGDTNAALFSSGFGAAPSGIGAAAQADVGVQAAKTASDQLFQNVAANENLKYQATQAQANFKQQGLSQLNGALSSQAGMAGQQATMANMWNPTQWMSAFKGASQPSNQQMGPNPMAAGIAGAGNALASNKQFGNLFSGSGN